MTKKQKIEAQRAEWRAAAQRERERMAEDPLYRISVLRRASVRRTMRPALWRSKIAEAKAEAARR